jgi:DNA-binding IclR family transcriptional regulator
MLAVLDLFTAESPSWTAEGISEKLSYSLPTGYRYVRELCDAGLLRRDSGGTYVLGPRIIELDHQIRTGDPLLVAARDTMRQLAETTGFDVVIGTLYSERIVTVHHELGAENIGASYGRGRRMPLFQGALSKVILAAIPRAQLRRLHERHGDAARDTDFAKDWDTLLANVKRIRGDGFAMTRSELDAGLVGLAVPLISPTRRVIASLGFVMSTKRFATLDLERSVAMLTDAAGRSLSMLESA